MTTETKEAPKTKQPKERREGPRPDHMYSKLLFITPEMASRWLEKNTRNRNLSEARAVQIIRKWERKTPDKVKASHQGIGFYSDGSLADGQHRLYACVKSGISFWSMVTWNVSEAAAEEIDQHRPRSEVDVIRIAGLSDWIGKTELSLIKMIASAHKKGTATYSVPILVEIGEAIKEPVLFAVEAFNGRKRKHVTVSPVLAAVAMASPYVEQVRLLEFCEVLITGVSESHEDAAAIRLRDQLISDESRGGQTARREILLKSMRAIKAFNDREELQRLYTPKEMIYRLPEIEEYL